MGQTVSESMTGQLDPTPTREQRDSAYSSGAGRKAVEVPKEEQRRKACAASGASIRAHGRALRTEAKGTGEPIDTVEDREFSETAEVGAFSGAVESSGLVGTIEGNQISKTAERSDWSATAEFCETLQAPVGLELETLADCSATERKRSGH